MCMRKKKMKEVKVSVGLRLTFFVNEEMFQYTKKQVFFIRKGRLHTDLRK